jgi:hypothetical protein
MRIGHTAWDGRPGKRSHRMDEEGLVVDTRSGYFVDEKDT